MLRLRPYKYCDADIIASWVTSEEAMYKWSADRICVWPFSGAALNDYYDARRDSDTEFPMTAFDDKGVCGHIMLRYVNPEKTDVRLGFVIVDISRRGQGLGHQLVSRAVEYAVEFLGAEHVNLGVFANNPAALHCYQAAGLRLTGKRHDSLCMGEMWPCDEMEYAVTEALDAPQ